MLTRQSYWINMICVRPLFNATSLRKHQWWYSQTCNLDPLLPQTHNVFGFCYPNHCDLNGKCIDRLCKEGFAVKFMLIEYTKLAPGKIRTLDGRRRPKELQTLMKLTCSIPDRTSFFLGTFLYFLKVFAYFRKKNSSEKNENWVDFSIHEYKVKTLFLILSNI